MRREFPAIIITERSTRPSADRKRSRSISRVVQRVTGASGGQDLLSRCAAECWAIRIVSRMCREMTIPHGRTAEDGAAMLADLNLATAGVQPLPAHQRERNRRRGGVAGHAFDDDADLSYVVGNVVDGDEAVVEIIRQDLRCHDRSPFEWEAASMPAAQQDRLIARAILVERRPGKS